MRNSSGIIIAVVLVLAGLAALLFLGAGNDRRLDRSVIGLSGLTVWLKHNDIAVRQAHERLSPQRSDLSLRVLPLYDMNLASHSAPPQTKREQYEQATQRDLSENSFDVKLEMLPTLVVLPKWRSAFMHSEVASPGGLIPLADYDLLLRQIGAGQMRLRRGGPEFVSEALDGHEVALFQPQLFDPQRLGRNCQPLVQMNGGVLIAQCGARHSAEKHTKRSAEKHTRHSMMLLSDPDLLNNHGLAVAENAGFVVEFLAEQVARLELDGSEGRDIYVDTSPYVNIQRVQAESERRDYERKSDELSRFYSYPFSLLWAMLLIVTGVLFWRGSVRFGPLAQASAARAATPAKTAAIVAQARLLRLSGNDGQMVADFVQGQLLDLTARTLGPDLGLAGRARYFAHLARRDADLATRFEAVAAELMARGAQMAVGELHQKLGTYKILLEQVESIHGSQ